MMRSRVQVLLDGYQTNSRMIRGYAEGLTDEGCLRQPNFEPLSFNWVLGHIVVHRNYALRALGADPVWLEASDDVYAEDPTLLTTLDQGCALAQLLFDLAVAEQRLVAALESVSESVLAGIVGSPFGEMTCLDRVTGLQWHETYHVGQLGLLRSLAKA